MVLGLLASNSVACLIYQQCPHTGNSISTFIIKCEATYAVFIPINKNAVFMLPYLSIIPFKEKCLSIMCIIWLGSKGKN